MNTNSILLYGDPSRVISGFSKIPLLSSLPLKALQLGRTRKALHLS